MLDYRARYARTQIIPDAPPVGRGFRVSGSPKICDFRPAPKPCIKNLSVVFLFGRFGSWVVPPWGRAYPRPDIKGAR